MLVDLVRATTSDGCMLDGALERPDPKVRPRLPLDAICLIHGTGSNFYQSTLLEFLAERFVESGVSVLRANTRGHDGISTTVKRRGGLRLGAAYEIVDDCRRDLMAWTQYLRENVGPGVALLGHSLGAVKCLYAAAHEFTLDPAFLVALSPPRLSYTRFCQSSRRDEFLETYRKAETLVMQGNGNSLLEVTMPLPMIITAGGYVEKYGPDERYDFLPLVPRLRTPTLFLFGDDEVAKNPAFEGLPEEMAALLPERRMLCEVVPGADHFYSGVRPQVWSAMLDGALRLLRGPG